MKKFTPGNYITEYLWKIFKKKYPDGTLYQMAKTIKVDGAQLYKMFKAENAFNQAIMLQRICSYLGIDMNEAVLGDKITKDEEIEYWKSKYELEKELRIKEQKNHKNILSNIQSIINQ